MINRKIIVLLIAFHLFLGTRSAYAAVSHGKKMTPQTLGELLRKENRGAGVQLKKTEVSIPSFSGFDFDNRGGANNVNLSEVKPPPSTSFFHDPKDDQSKLEALTDRQIQELFKLTQKYQNGPQRGELWLRLAELYVEKADFINFRRQGEYDKKIKDFQDGKTKAKPTLNLHEAQDYNRKAIQLYEWFVRDFSRDPKMDQALFFLGYNYYEVGNQTKGTHYYSRLVKEFPKSTFVIESNFALAENYFENEKWALAIKHYQEVTKHPRYRLALFANYKLAWCEFRSGNGKKALGMLDHIVRENRQRSSESGDAGKRPNKYRLEAESTRDLVLFYGEAGDYQQAEGYFKGLLGQDADKYLEKLAYLYGAKGNRDGARLLFNYLIAQNPTAPKAFDYKYEIVKAYSNATKTQDFRDELKSWVQDFGKESDWAKTNAANTDLIQNSEKLREQTLRTWVLQQHQTAQNSRAPFSQKLAYEGYRIYLAQFPNSKQVADMRFYYGELLYDMGKFDEAGEQYRWVAEKAPNSKFAQKASENVVLALEKDLPKDKELANRVGGSIEPVELDAHAKSFISGGEWYIKKFPNTEKSLEIRFRIGRLYYQHNQFEQAIPYFKEIVARNSRGKFAEFSANLLLDIYNLKKDYAGLEKTGNELLQNPNIASSSAGQDIRNVLERTTFKKAQDFEAAKNYRRSAELYEAFAKQNPKSELSSAASFNAAINYERSGQPGKALALHQVVLASSAPKAQSLKPQSRRITAKLYQDSGQLEAASVAYRSAALEAGNDKVAGDLYYNAAILDEMFGKNESAVKNYEAFMKNGKKADKEDVLFNLATMYRKQNHITAAIDRYQDFLNLGPADKEKMIESCYWTSVLSKRLNRETEADKWRRLTLYRQRNLAPDQKGAGASWAAKFKLEDAKETFKDFKSIRLTNFSRLKEMSDNKIAFLKKLGTQIGEIIKFDSAEEIVAALSLLGQANEQMAQSFIDAPLPRELKTPDQAKQYREGVAKLAQPFQEKAVEAFRTAVDRARDFEIQTDDSDYALQRMKLVDAAHYPDFGESFYSFRQESEIE